MKILIVAYIKSENLLEEIEEIICYDRFQITETNRCYRVFTGHFTGPAIIYFKKLYQQLEDFEFNIEDSMFLSYPGLAEDKSLTILTLVLKRKGNRHLRRLEYR